MTNEDRKMLIGLARFAAWSLIGYLAALTMIGVIVLVAS